MNTDYVGFGVLAVLLCICIAIGVSAYHETTARDFQEQAVKRGLAKWVTDSRGMVVRFEWTASVGREPYDDSKDTK